MKKSVFLVLLVLTNCTAYAQVIWPLANLPDNDLRDDISSPYGPRVINNGNYDFHHALDIVATVNNVYSVDDGTVVKVGSSAGHGYVVIAYSYQNNPQHVPYYVRYYGLSERDVDKDSTVNQGELIGKYSYAYAHLDMKYYPDFGNSPYPVYQSSDNTQNPLALLPYNNNAATQRVTFSNISWVQDDPNDPSKDYVSVTVVDDGLDLNDITVFITANDELGGPLDQGDILYGVNTPYNEINYDTRRNCSNDQHYANGYGNNTSLENSFAGTGGVLIIPANYNHWTGGKKVEFRFLLNPAQARHIQNNKMWVGVKATDLKTTQYTQNWVSVIPTPIGGGGPSGVPTNVTATPYAANMSVNLSWQSGANTEFFSVYRHLTAESDSAYQLIGITQDPSFEDTYKTIPGASYTYSIVGDNGGRRGSGIRRSNRHDARERYRFF